jgi:hypothetical protein
MCPACIATSVWIALGASSAGGLTALVARVLLARTGAPTARSETPTQGEEHERAEDRVPG